MKAFKFWFSAFVLLFFLSCEEDKVRFLEPQPAGIDSDTELRKKFLGTYLSDADSSYLIVSSDRVVYKPFSFNVRIDSGDVSAKKGDVDVNIRSNDSSSRVSMKIQKSSDDDSLMMNAEAEDEIFSLKSGGVAKYHKGYYFLNSPFEEGSGYRVRILKLTKEGIILSRIASDSVLHLLEREEFVRKELKGDDEEENWKLNPSRKQLKKMMNMGLFSDVQAFKRSE